MAARAWCITLNCAEQNIPTESEWKTWMEQLNAERYCAQVETGESGTPHVQAYVYIASKARLSALKKVLPRAHLEIRKGTEKEAWEYCTKEPTRSGWRLEHGAPISGQGHRSDLESACAILKEAPHGLKRVAEEFPIQIVKYHKGLASLNALLHPVRSAEFRPITVTVLWGDPGSGKTRRACEESGGDLYKLASYKPEWWDGYIGQKHLLLDDFYGQMEMERFLMVTDGYEFALPVKGGFAGRPVWTHIWITSNAHPSDWWSEPGQKKPQPGALTRRFTGGVHHMEKEAAVAATFEQELGYA